MQKQTLTKNRILLITWALLFIMPLIGMAIDLISPSLPAIAKNLEVNTAITQWLISIYLLGYAFGNFFTGFLTDAIGRQKLLRFTLLGFVISSLLPLFLPNIAVLLLTRLLQGLTLGACAVLIRAIFMDVLTNERLATIGNLMGLMWGLGPIIGPFIGGYLQYYYGWSAIFYFFATITSFIMIAIFLTVPETHHEKRSLKLKDVSQNLIAVIRNKDFMGLVTLMGLVYSLIIAFNTMAPFLLQNILRYTSIDFGHIALMLGIVYLCSTFIARYIIKYFDRDRIYLITIHLLMAISIIALALSFYFPLNSYLILITSACMFVACAFIVPMTMGYTMSFLKHIAGTATAVLLLSMNIITTLVSVLSSFLYINSAFSLLCIYFVILTIVTILYWAVIRKMG